MAVKSVFKTNTISILALSLSIGLSACSTLGIGGDKKEKLAYVERPAELIYNQGFERMERQDWDRAKLFFQEVERQHPFSKWARRAMLMQAYANYRSADYEESAATAERFIGLHPGNESTPYAYYLIAMTYYDQIYDVGRDQATGKEMTIGRYYLKDNQQLAAIGRFKNVVRDYETTSQTEEALHRLVEAYTSLGIINEAKLVGSVLGHNYPSSEWYEDSYDLLSKYGVDLNAEIAKPRKQGYWSRLRERLF